MHLPRKHTNADFAKPETILAKAKSTAATAPTRPSSRHVTFPLNFPIHSPSNLPNPLQRAYSSGHQIASHTWSHQDLMTLDATHYYEQIYYNEMALRNILGFIPTYFRPPYVDCDDACHATLGELGYHSIYYDIDTFDYENDAADLIQTSKNNFAAYIDPKPTNALSLEHDTHYQTVYNLTAFLLQTIAANGYGTSVTVGECLGDPPANWYRAASGTTG